MMFNKFASHVKRIAWLAIQELTANFVLLLQIYTTVIVMQPVQLELSQ